MSDQTAGPPDHPIGILDTNVFIHAQTGDAHSEECRRFLLALADGRVRAYLPFAVLHELSYALPRYVRQMTKWDVATYLRTLLAWPGIEGDTDVMTDTVRRWTDTPGLGFVDAYLVALATRRACPIYSKNRRELVRQGVTVPPVLPSSR